MQNEKVESNYRKCTVKCDRIALTSFISSELRSRGIPMILLGGDIIRGAVFDMMDHPENSIAESIGRAVDFSKFPGTLSNNGCGDDETRKERDICKGYNLIYDAIEASMVKDIPWIPGNDQNALQRKVEVVDCVLKSMAANVRRAYCYALTIKYFNSNPLSLDTLLGKEIIKDMVFKKLVADDSTKECMYEYAFRKEFNLDRSYSYQQKKVRIFHTMSNYCRIHKVTPYQLACRIVDDIYAQEAKKTR